MGKTCHKILISLLIIAVALAVIIGFQRYTLERNYKTVETVMSLNKVRELALKEGLDEYILLEKLKTHGLTSIGIQEDSIETLMLEGKVAFGGSAEIAKLNWFNESFLIPENGDLYGKNLLICQDHSLWQRIKEYLQNYLGINRVQELILKNYHYSLLITGDPEELLKLGVGFSEADIIKIKNLGFHVILRPKNSPKVKTEVLAQKLSALEAVENVSLIIFDEEEVLGNPVNKQLLTTANFLKEHNYPFGIIEFTSQKGIDVIADSVSSLAVRVHSITKEEMETISQKKALDRWLRAAQERNIRLFYINPFLNIREGSIVEANLGYLEKIKEELAQNGFHLGQASLLPEFQISLIFIYLIGIGVIAAGIILLKEFFKFQDRFMFVLFFLGLFFLFFLNLIAGKIWLIKILALSVALLFPSLAVIKNKKYLLSPSSEQDYMDCTFTDEANSYPGLIKKIFLGISGIMGFSVVGGLLVGALLTNYQFMLAIRLFSGIKIAYIVPLLVIALYLWWKENKENMALIEELRKPILFEHALMVFILFAFLAVYILRSGNFSFLPVPAIEEKMRLFLEKTLVARPRNKEFLIGYPLLTLAITLNHLRIAYLKKIIIIMGSVAPVTVLNTFCHVHTPLCFSLLRTMHGYWLGLLLGMALATIFYFSLKIFGLRFNEQKS